MLLGGAPNTALARFAATLPAGESDDADTMLVLLTLLTRRTVTARLTTPLLQKPEAETSTIVDRLASEPGIRAARESRVPPPGARPGRARTGAALPARTADEYDRKIIGLVREAGEVNARMVKLMLDLDTPPTSRVLADLAEREILVKT
jgi:ATP-dependent DNA helicase RecG